MNHWSMDPWVKSLDFQMRKHLTCPQRMSTTRMTQQPKPEGSYSTRSNMKQSEARAESSTQWCSSGQQMVHHVSSSASLKNGKSSCLTAKFKPSEPNSP